ncbi:heparan-alpha-glucosaminide N-acetyltransferase domain-containing protein [Rothia sp. ZJ932]|uniref:heparan-alpha-glucosaminide N-acetyltransferase domain-containing protein n=1 Tax=Rothia sp. ZJ932 TaxID=2810516 RepID=UPI0019673CD2|nr:heparan-alpha-glucosaminide N-acetyltransferase domain-containing protein [Rothia sp. ZJ932]QRZ61551.1 DUF1624 domain-containing protein [Rothia sp. ZJ932]
MTIGQIPSSSVFSRLARLGAAPRLAGLDLARGLAIIGMIAAHTYPTADVFSLFDVQSYNAIVHGHPSLLFALLAGVSISLMTKAAWKTKSAEAVTTARINLMIRGIIIFGFGLLLESLGTSIMVILTLYGALYMVMLPFVTATSRALLWWSAGIMVIGPPLIAVTQTLMPSNGFGYALVFQSIYSPAAWTSLMLLGMYVGRLDLGSFQVLAKLAGAGVGLMVLSSGLALVLGIMLPGLMSFADSSSSPITAEQKKELYSAEDVPPETVPSEDFDFTKYECERFDKAYIGCTLTGSKEDLDKKKGESEEEIINQWSEVGERLVEPDLVPTILAVWIASEPHAGGTLEIMGSGGLALVVVSVCLMVAARLRWLALPIVALGTMPLTVYSLHVLSVFIMVGPGGVVRVPWFFWTTAGVFLLFSVCWFAFFAHGPLERVVRYAVQKVTGSYAGVRASE